MYHWRRWQLQYYLNWSIQIVKQEIDILLQNYLELKLSFAYKRYAFPHQLFVKNQTQHKSDQSSNTVAHITFFCISKQNITLWTISTMDTFFLAHGSVTLVVDETIPVRSFLQSWKSDTMQEAPRAILMISGHWDTDGPTVNLVHGENDTIHDFKGFPRFFYEVRT